MDYYVFQIGVQAHTVVLSICSSDLATELELDYDCVWDVFLESIRLDIYFSIHRSYV